MVRHVCFMQGQARRGTEARAGPQETGEGDEEAICENYENEV